MARMPRMARTPRMARWLADYPDPHSDSDYTFLVMFPGCRTSNLTAGVTGHRYVGRLFGQ